MGKLGKIIVTAVLEGVPELRNHRTRRFESKIGVPKPLNIVDIIVRLTIAVEGKIPAKVEQAPAVANGAGRRESNFVKVIKAVGVFRKNVKAAVIKQPEIPEPFLVVSGNIKIQLRDVVGHARVVSECVVVVGHTQRYAGSRLTLSNRTHEQKQGDSPTRPGICSVRFACPLSALYQSIQCLPP